jgi:molybdopterin-guanine dinucleotide biosynthesis protein A
LPIDLVHRLSQALAESQADIAIARTPNGLEPAFCLIKRELRMSLLGYMQSGQRKIERWTAQHRRAEAMFDNDSAFFNINTPDDLARG